MRVLIVIPARYQSKRFPGKPLVPLTGAGGEARSLLQRTHDVAKRVSGHTRVVVATDDARIAAHAESWGGDVVMTSSDCRNGTERCAEVADAFAAAGETFDLVVNLQGDAPLTPPAFVDALIAQIGDAPVATPALRGTEDALRRFREDRAAGQVGATTLVRRRDGMALYFSKEVIPFAGDADTPVYHHVGLYAYTLDALKAYRGWPEGRLERAEGLEQLRFLEEGVSVRAVEVSAGDGEFWEVNNPIDVARVEAALQARGIR